MATLTDGRGLGGKIKKIKKPIDIINKLCNYTYTTTKGESNE